MKNVIAYIRVSTSKQKKEGESLHDQTKAINEYCKLHNFNIIKTFSDDFTGTTTKRPGVLEMYNYLEKSKGLIDIKYCVIRQIDRSSRGGTKIYDEFKEALADYGVQLKDTYGVIQGKRRIIDDIGDVKLNYDFCYNEPSKSSEAMMAIMAEEERKQILRRTIPREIALEQEGYQVRPSNYGFENKKINTPNGKRTIQVENPTEGKWLKEMFQQRIKGVKTDTEIVENLILKGCKKRSDRDMTVAQMQRFIANPIYAGIRISKWTGNKPIKTRYKGLVSIEVWNRANRGKRKLIEGKNGEISIKYYQKKELKEEPIKIKRKSYNPFYPYAKMFICPECGRGLTGSASRSKDGSLHHYYHCRGTKKDKHKTYSIRQKDSHSTLLNIFKSAKPSGEILNLYDEVVNEVYEEIKAEKEKNSFSYKQQLKELEKKAQSILDDIHKVIDFPIILETKNRELKTLKIKKQELEYAIKNESKNKEFEEFRQSAKMLISHTDKLAQQSQNPKFIQLAFKVVFGGKVQYEKLGSHTPYLQAFFPSLSQQKNSSNDEFCENNKWGTEQKLPHTLSKDFIKKNQKVKLKLLIYELMEIYEEYPMIRYINYKKLK